MEVLIGTDGSTGQWVKWAPDILPGKGAPHGTRGYLGHSQPGGGWAQVGAKPGLQAALALITSPEFLRKGQGEGAKCENANFPTASSFLLFGFSPMTTCPKGLGLHRWREPLLRLPEPRKRGLSTLPPEPGGPALESMALECSSPAPGFVVSLCSTQESQEGVRPPPVGR